MPRWVFVSEKEPAGDASAPNQGDDAGPTCDESAGAVDDATRAPGASIPDAAGDATPDSSGDAAATVAPEDRGHRRAPLPAAMLAALGVVFGDIGTSPLYSLQTVFSIDHNSVAPTHLDVYGVISLVFWSILAIVSLKYVLLVMRADNDGEGGILALTALLRRVMPGRRAPAVITVVGIVGAGLFYGDSVITPAISVMSAVEGVEIVAPGAARFILPVSVTILTVLFAVQRFGTAAVGRLFGPVMVLWFATLALLGLPHIAQPPQVVAALSPTYAVRFWVERPVIAFIAMGAVVLTITGAEALYADVGHFGPRPIRLAWFLVVFPCLTLNYLGQAALILLDPAAIDNPFFHLVPNSLVLPVVVLATAATVIASQSVISGAFSVSQQALHLGLLPRLTVRHTSKEEGGQIYVPVINWTLFVGVIVLVLGFKSSAALANAYGLAVTGTLVLTTILFLGLAHRAWKWPMWLLVLVMVTIGGLEATYLAANLTKIAHGGWLPIVIASAVIIVMTTWQWGVATVVARRRAIGVPMQQWLAKASDPAIPRVEGQAIYLHSSFDTVPLALKETLRFHHVLHERTAIVKVAVENRPHVRHVDRVHIEDLGGPHSGIVGVTITLGFNDSQDIPHNLAWSHGKNAQFEFDPEQARYFLSVLTMLPIARRTLEHSSGHSGDGVIDAPAGTWFDALRSRLFIVLSRNAGSRVEAFHLPPNRTAILGGRLQL